MPGRGTHVLGVDIGNAILKVVELRLSGRGIELVGTPAVAPTPPGSVTGGVVTDADAVAQALRAMISSHGLKARLAVSAVGGDTSCIVRIADMPRMSSKELAEAVKWELDRQTPFPVDSVIYDYEPIEHPDLPVDEQTMQVLLAVAQEDMVNAHIEALRGAKLAPLAVDIEPLAISRALVNSVDGKYADQVVVLCDIGATKTGIYIVRKNTLNFVRTVPTAGEALTSAIRQNLAEDEKQAEQFKCQFADLTGAYSGTGPSGGSQPAAAGEEGGTAPQVETAVATEEISPEVAEDIRIAKQEVYEAISPVVLDLATEIERSVEYYRRQHRNEEVSRIILCGGTSLIPGLAEFIAGETGIETEVGNPFEHLSIDEDAQIEAYLRDIAPVATLAIGLAMRDMVD